MKLKSKPAAYELVIWEDPASEFDGWTKIEDISTRKQYLVMSIGWPIREDDIHLYLAMDYLEGEANTVGRIPLAAIKARKRINLRGFPPKEKSSEGDAQANPPSTTG